MKIRSPRAALRLLAVLLAAFGMQGAFADTPVATGAGIYKGTYSSDAADGDSGTVTIIVNAQGGTACDFKSTQTGNDLITTGGWVKSSTPYLALTCTYAESFVSASWLATTNSSSMAGQSLFGSWQSVAGLDRAAGTFNAAFVSALNPISPATITGLWYEPGKHDGGFNFLFADQGLLVTYIGVTQWGNVDSKGNPIGVPIGTKYWLISDTGPTTVLPGTSINLAMWTAPGPSSTSTAVVAAGSFNVIFFDCKLARATLSGPAPFEIIWTIYKLAGVANQSDC